MLAAPRFSSFDFDLMATTDDGEHIRTHIIETKQNTAFLGYYAHIHNSGLAILSQL